MLNRTKSFLILLFACAVIIIIAGDAGAAKIYLDPDTVFVITSVDPEINLALKVDAATTGLKLFEYAARCFPEIVDTVSITEGPLFPSTGQPTAFGYYLLEEDTVLKLEDLILGAGVTVNGPGVLANITLTATNPGKADMRVIKNELRDVNNVIFPSTAGGAVVFVDFPPLPFDLMAPADAAEVHEYPRDSLELVWRSSKSVYPSEGVTYKLEYGTSPTFEAGVTTTVGGLPDTSYTLYTNDLSTQVYYWRVTATGDAYGFERESSPTSASFSFVLDNPLTAFSLIYPGNGQTISGVPGEQVIFNWHKSSSVYAGEWVQYRFELSTTANFLPGTVLTRTVADTTNGEPVDNFDEVTYYWRVTAIGGLYSYERQSTPFPGSFAFQEGTVEPAEFSLLAPDDSATVEVYFSPPTAFAWENAGSGVPNDTLVYHFYVAPDHNFPGSAIRIDSVQDVTEIAVDSSGLTTGQWLFWKVRATNKFDLTRWSTVDRAVMFYWRGDVNNDHKINLTDITRVIAIVYLSGVPSAPSEAADVNCDTKANLTDITRMISFVYLSGEGFICP